MCYNLIRKANMDRSDFMYCKYCGKEIDDNSIFCPSCGNISRENTPAANDQMHGSQNIQSSSFNSPKQGLAITSLVLGIASLILFFVFYISIPCALIGRYLGKESIRQKMGGKQYAKSGIKLCEMSIKISCGVAIVYLLLLLILVFVFQKRSIF